MPESTLKWQAFNQKKPYFIATVFTLVAGVLAIGFLFDKLSSVKEVEYAKIQPDVEKEQHRSDLFKKAYGDMKKTQADVDQTVEWMDDRFYWVDVVSEVKNVLTRVEAGTKNKMRTDTGVWIEQMVTAVPEGRAGEGG